jgi:uncharacterized protein YkwD
MTLDTPPSPAAVTGPPAASTPTGARRARPACRWRIAAPVVALVAVALAAAGCAPPGSPGSGATGDMVQAINQDRGANGLGGLAWDDQLHHLAQDHANEIAASGSLWHSDLGGWLAAPWMVGWRSLGENLAQGGPGSNAWGIEDMWMGSSPHRANILNGGFNRIGVGVTVDGAGRVWMVALFGAR